MEANSDNEELGPVALASLKMAGWFPERNVPTDVFESAIRDFGLTIPLPLPVKKFLQEFGGLRLCRGYPPDVIFDPIDEFKFLKKELPNSVWIQATGELLYPVGGYIDHMTVLMGESGKVYGSDIPNLVLLAGDGRKFISQLFERQQPPIELIVILSKDHLASEPMESKVINDFRLESNGEAAIILELGTIAFVQQHPTSYGIKTAMRASLNMVMVKRLSVALSEIVQSYEAANSKIA